MDNRNIKELLKNIQASVRCPNCGASYRSGNIHLLGQLEVIFIVHLFCGSCETSALATLIVGEENVISKIVTNLQGNFREKVREAVTTDDLLDLHKFLTNFDGDFKKEIQKL